MQNQTETGEAQSDSVQSEAAASPSSLLRRIVQFPLVLMIIGFAMQVAVMMLGAYIVQAIHAPQTSPLYVLKALIICGLALGTHYLFNRYVDDSPHNDLSLRGAGREFLGGYGTGVGIFTLIVAVVWIMGGYGMGKMNDWNTIWLMLASVSLAPGVTEEIIFRGLFFRFVERMGGTWIALIASALLFGLAHFGNPNAGLVPAIAIAIEAGLLLGAVYLLTRRLWAAIGLHAAWNFTQGWIFGIPVSGTNDPGLVTSVREGPEWLTGGAFGLEASMVALVIATLAGIGIARIAYRKGRFIAMPKWGQRLPLN